MVFFAQFSPDSIPSRSNVGILQGVQSSLKWNLFTECTNLPTECTSTVCYQIAVILLQPAVERTTSLLHSNWWCPSAVLSPGNKIPYILFPLCLLPNENILNMGNNNEPQPVFRAYVTAVCALCQSPQSHSPYQDVNGNCWSSLLKRNTTLNCLSTNGAVQWLANNTFFSLYLLFAAVVDLFFFLFTIQMERALLTQKMMELDSSKSSTRTLQHELEMANKQVKVLEQQVRDLQTEAKRLSETISHLRDDKVKLETGLEDQRRRNSSLELASDSRLSFLCIKCQWQGVNYLTYVDRSIDIINW